MRLMRNKEFWLAIDFLNQLKAFVDKSQNSGESANTGFLKL